MEEKTDIDAQFLRVDTDNSSKRSIRRRYFITIFSSMMLVFFLVLTSFYFMEVNYIKKIASARLSARLASMTDVIYVSIDEIVEDTQLLKHILNTPLEQPRWDKNALKVLYDFARTKPGYVKLQLLNYKGMEKIRINRRASGPVIADTGSLQDKSEKDYFKLSRQLSSKNVFISSLVYTTADELATNDDMVLRVTTPVFDSNNDPIGILVLNYLGSEIFKSARRVLMGSDTSGSILYVLNTNGEAIFSDKLDDSKTSTETPCQGTDSLELNRYLREISASDSGSLMIPQGIMVYNTVYPQNSYKERQEAKLLSYRPAIKLIMLMPHDILMTPAKEMLIRFSLISIPVVLGTLIFAWLYANAVATRRYLEKSMHKAAITDPLTGIYNRRFGELQLNHEISRAKRDASPLSVFIIDINNLKGVNDLFGHSCGDDLITKVTGKLSGNLREYDIICRTGGDEFMAVFPQTTVEQGKTILERLRADLEEVNRGKYAPFGINFAYGGAQYSAEKHRNSKELMAEADEAMYADKHARQQGREEAHTPL